MVDPASDRIPRVPPYSGTTLRSHKHFAYGAFTLSGRLSQNLSSTMHNQMSRSCNPEPFAWRGLGSSGFARRYYRNHYYFLFPGYLDGSVPPVSLPHTMYSYTDDRLASAGLPHSAIDGSRDVCSSPSLFAACHGLRRQVCA